VTKKRCLEDGDHLRLESAFIAILFCFVDVGKINKKHQDYQEKSIQSIISKQLKSFVFVTLKIHIHTHVHISH